MTAIDFRCSPHPGRHCGNCAHTDADEGCLQLVRMADGGPMPAGFACDQHQTHGEFEMDLYRYRYVPLFVATRGAP
jgi:hypothetical protein